MVVLAHGDKLTARDVPAAIRDALGPASAAHAPRADGSLASLERDKIIASLRKFGGNKTRAALELGISRRTLHRKVNEYKLEGIAID